MSKAGNILLLVMAFFSITGAMHETKATKKITQDLSSCSASRVSTKLCEEILNQSCIASPEETLKQAQGNVIVAGSQSQTLQASSAIDPIVLPTMQPLAPESLQNDTPLNSDLIFDLANQFRASVGLAPFEKDDKVCELAESRSNELAGEITNGNIHSGLYNRNLPYWIFENAKVGSNEQGTVSWWLSSPIHKSSVVGDYRFSCVKCTGTYCSQLFTSFSPK
ncbi:MAG: hypothetical protein A3C27_02565 [Candidatus Levybacteria bacterium RIFCSPHIGHO2_02_FULL_39_36]|nr:MAG: hypothetical protein UT20_C0006G0002 [Candidatus Levybacteria bacterium GW2011_GWA1_39_11]KKR25491.1 MAG: hypothetical protein UT57_C0068G0004 [Microgenomates group bacterium GW2011_GWC1_39_7]OGH15495.1 MAG: hypothetical protein A2689_00530 [Candidatus Levybacteria bacterium RIFCSPHIGHO2_01_FULL_38_96]OGH25367.1 MAG: hypothetical protein A3E68_02115 [Candidatus Levybacteria bacterium RIFCSPHIGHO2_12_FULL_39_39]OGH28772.1 MAG: hypothetical protein A3C27_02565 [Candidatus Levybacteria bac